MTVSRLFFRKIRGASETGRDGARRGETGRDGARWGETGRDGARRALDEPWESLSIVRISAGRLLQQALDVPRGSVFRVQLIYALRREFMY